MSFLITFDSLLVPRIARIRKAFARRDREEIMTALLSLQASSVQKLQWSDEVYRIHGYERGDIVPSSLLSQKHIVAERWEQAQTF